MDTLNEERLLVQRVVFRSTVISTQLYEECNLLELIPHGLHIIEDSQDRIFAIGIVLVSTVISIQLYEEGNLLELIRHDLHVIKYNQDRIFAIRIGVNNISKVYENIREELVSLHCYLKPCTRKICKKLDVVLKVAILSIVQ